MKSIPKQLMATGGDFPTWRDWLIPPRRHKAPASLPCLVRLMLQQSPHGRPVWAGSDGSPDAGRRFNISGSLRTRTLRSSSLRTLRWHGGFWSHWSCNEACKECVELVLINLHLTIHLLRVCIHMVSLIYFQMQFEIEYTF